MREAEIKKLYGSITNVKDEFIEEAQTVQFKRKKPLWLRAAAAVLVVVLSLTLAVPVLAANVEAVHQLVYDVSPAMAQYLQPVKLVDENNGIRMEVVSAKILNGGTAEIYITMQDLTEDRINETIDLFDYYNIYRSFGGFAHCQLAEFDSATRVATYCITLRQNGTVDMRNFAGEKITFFLGRFFTQTHHEDVEIPYDLSMVNEAAETWQPEIETGDVNPDIPFEGFNALVPGEPYEGFPVDGIDMTGIGFVDGTLHIQIRVEDTLTTKNHGHVYLVNADGKQIRGYSRDFSKYTYKDGEVTDRTAYLDFVFFITPEELAECKLYGNFWISDPLTEASIEGGWRVTVPLELADRAV